MIDDMTKIKQKQKKQKETAYLSCCVWVCVCDVYVYVCICVCMYISVCVCVGVCGSRMNNKQSAVSWLIIGCKYTQQQSISLKGVTYIEKRKKIPHCYVPKYTNLSWWCIGFFMHNYVQLLLLVYKIKLNGNVGIGEDRKERTHLVFTLSLNPNEW